jgi:hypothetical protein
MKENIPFVEIFSKENCHLCEEAKAVITRVKADTEFEISITDINLDPDIFEKYKYEIPVIHINGVIAFKYKVDETEFRRKLNRKF